MGRLHPNPSRVKINKPSVKYRLNLSEDTSLRKRFFDQTKLTDTSASSKPCRKGKKNGLSFTPLKATWPELDASSSDKSSNDGSDVGDEDWLDESNLLAQYNDSDSATEEERAAALLDELQVSFQENTTQLKQSLCNSLLRALNDIRQTHVSIDHGPDVERGKGIAIFSSACDKRHTNAQRLQAELQDDLAEKQAEMKQILGQLKQCYTARKKLWSDVEAKVLELTNRQTEILERCEKETAEAMSNFEEKYGSKLKEKSLKNKERLLRDVLDKL